MRRVALVLIAAAAASCHGSGERLGSDSWADAPVDGTDAAWDAADARDVAPEPAADTGCFLPPPCPDSPPDGVMGAPCIMNEDCSAVRGSYCITERLEGYDGEYYVSYLGGSCLFFGETESGCDPRDHSTCPDGSRCLAGDMWVGCFDECAPGDASGEMHDWACGCRKGYACDVNLRVCLPGCSNDRECCESWEDADGDYRRDDGEVTRWPGCTSWCDGDDPDEWADCRASFACVNTGTPGARIGDACRHDSHCPVDGTCLAWTDPDTGEEHFPGGYCTRTGCQFPSRGCEADGGACVRTGPVLEPAGMCLRPCHVERLPGDPDFECRTTPGEEQACLPIHRLGWMFGPPEGGEDGYCFPGSFAPGPGALAEPCAGASDCASPRGLGECMEWLGTAPFCTIRCNEYLAEEESICGPAGEGEIAPALCGWSTCLLGCSHPSVPPGANGCPPAFACVPLSYIGTTWAPAGALRPPGLCLPACDSDAFCEDVYEEGARCDTTSGICH